MLLKAEKPAKASLIKKLREFRFPVQPQTTDFAQSDLHCESGPSGGPPATAAPADQEARPDLPTRYRSISTTSSSISVPAASFNLV